MNNKFKVKSRKQILPLFLVIISFFLSVGFAKVNNVMLDVTGIAEAIIAEDLIITDVKTSDQNNIIIYSYEQTILNSKVILANNDINSTKSLELTIYNNSNNPHFFKEVVYTLGDITYSNENIDFEIDNRLDDNYKLETGSSVTFTIMFKYSDEYKENHPEILENELKSILKFEFGHKIIFDINGGNPQEIDSYFLNATSNTTKLANDIPTKTGYLFTGWYDGKDYKNSQMYFDEEQKINNLNNIEITDENITLYAGWKPIKYTITLNTKAIVLPDEYRELEYIESNGKQYFDTGYYPSSNTVVEAKLYSEMVGNKNWFGSSNNNSTSYILNSMNRDSVEIKYGISSWNVVNAKDAVTNTPFTVSYGKIIKINGNIIKDNSSMGDFQDTSTLWILSRNNGSAGSRIAGRIYYFKIYEDGELKRDYVPCFRKADKISGLFDTVTGEFLTDKNGGNFNYTYNEYLQELEYDKEQLLLDYDYNDTEYSLVGWSLSQEDSEPLYYRGEKVKNISTIDGSNINLYAKFRKKLLINFDPNYGLNNGYDIGYYVESPGGLYIDTGYYPTNNTKVETKLFTNEVGNKNWFGASITSGYAFSFNSYNYRQIEYNYGNSGWKTFSLPYDVVGKDFTVSFSKKILINGTEIVNNSSLNMNDSDKSLLLFARNGGTINNRIAGKMYYFRIYEDNVLVKNLVPCSNNGIVYLCDTLDSNIYASSGNGNLSLGNLSQLIDYGTKEKLNSNPYEKAEYRFVSWNTKRDGTGDNYLDEDEINISPRYDRDELNLYAQWEKVN